MILQHRTEPIPVLNYDKDYWQISQLGRGNSMSTTFEIIRFAKPSKKELQMLDYFSEYDSFRGVDFDGNDTSEYIRLFRTNDKLFSNLVGSRFAQRIELPEIVTDYKT